MEKRGRKPKPKERKGYFYEEQEQAVIDYITLEDKEKRQEIYNIILRPAFEKMVESIIRRYKLYVPDEDFESTFNDTLSFLDTKINKFKPGKHKAYSYCGTICKHYLLAKIGNYNKRLERNPSFDVSYKEYNNNIKYSVETDSNEVAKDLMLKIVTKIKKMIESPSEYKLKEEEIKIGKVLSNLLENWDYVLTTDGSNKLNKSAIFLYLKENTGFDTKGIRNSMKKFKKMFYNTKTEFLNSDE